jgi:hypothetical protein
LKVQIESYQVLFSFGLVLSPESNRDCSPLLTGRVPEASNACDVASKYSNLF